MQAHKPEFENLMNYIREGDTIVIWKLDRLGRSTKELLDLIEMLSKRGINLISLNDPIDTTSASRVLVFQIFCALAEHERNLMVQRTKAGLQEPADGKGVDPRACLPNIKKLPRLWESFMKPTNNLLLK